MNNIREFNEFVTANQVRRIAQDALKPLIIDIEDQIQKLKKQSQKINLFEKSISNTQAAIRQFNGKLVQFKLESTDLKNMNNKNALNCTNNFQSLKQEINSVKRQLKRKEDSILQSISKSTALEGRFVKLQQSTEVAIQSMRQKINQIHSSTMQQIVKSAVSFKKSTQALQITQKEIQNQRIRYRESTNVIQLYLIQKQQFNRRINEGIDRIMNCITIQQFRQLQQRVKQQIKAVDRVQDSIKSLPTKDDLSDISIIVRNVEEKVLDFAKIMELELEVNLIKKQIDQKQKQKKGKYNYIQQMIDKIQSKLEQMKAKRLDDYTQSQKTQSQKIKEFFMSQMTFLGKKIDNKIIINNQQSQKKFIQLLQAKQQEFKRRQIKLKEDVMKEYDIIAAKIGDRCLKIENLGQGLQQNLLGFNNKITKMKSDNELFKELTNKQYKQMAKNKLEINQKMKQIGEILSSFLQLFAVSSSISLYESFFNTNQKMVFVTDNDGIICQIQRQSENESQFIYRKKILNPNQLKKSIMMGIIELMDQTIQQYNFLNVKQHKPSYFFYNNILNHYDIQFTKYNKKSSIHNLTSHHCIQPTYSTFEKDRLGDHKDKFKRQKTAQEKNNYLTLNQQQKKYTIKVPKNNRNNSLFQNRVSTARSGRYHRLKNVFDI